MTTREFQSATLAARGLTNKQIARELGISPATVKIHVAGAMRKLDAATRGALWHKLAELAP